MASEQTIQLPPDSTANKNLLRAFEVTVGDSTTLQQAIVFADADGHLVATLGTGLSVGDAQSRQLLTEIRDQLQLVVGLLGG